MTISQTHVLIGVIDQMTICNKDLFVQSIKESQKFLLGDVNNLPSSEEYPDEIRLPFKKVCLEVKCETNSPYTKLGKQIILCEEKENFIILNTFLFSRKFKQWKYNGLIVYVPYTNMGGVIYNTHCCFKESDMSVDIEYQEEMALWAYNVLVRFINILNCNNVQIEEQSVPVKLQKKRKVKNKIPFFSHYVLKIKQSSRYVSKNSGTTKTHASPRVHLRRGHIRRLNAQKTTWVQSCVVGDKTRGMVTKDYIV